VDAGFAEADSAAIITSGQTPNNYLKFNVRDRRMSDFASVLAVL